MNSPWGSLGRGARLLLVTLLLIPLVAGCKFKDQVKAEISRFVPKGFVESTWFVVNAKLSGTFSENGQVKTLICRYTVSGEVDGQPVTKTVKVTLEAKGDKGDEFSLRCDDPLVVQFPADAAKFHATAVKGAAVSVLPVHAGLHILAIAPGKHLVAMHGRQLVVIGMPAHMKGIFRFRLSFSLGSSRSIVVRPFFTAKVSCHHGTTYYPPVLPLVTRIRAVSPMLLPESARPLPLLPNVASARNGKVLVDCR